MESIKSYEPSRMLDSFYVRGFQFWDGASVLEKIKAGDTLTLYAEPDNPYDSQAIAVYYGNAKLGYVPREDNSIYSTLFYFGHSDVFEARVIQVDKQASIYEQVRFAIYAKDTRAQSFQ